jgi:uncharacterized oligopeptide transporter (OPT) family protein
MLIPRYSLRWMLGVTACCALISTVLSFALRGQPWALGLSLALGVLIGCFLVYGVVFVVAYQLANLLRVSRRAPLTGSPFASENQPPPQVVVPFADAD